MAVTPGTFLACWMLAPWEPMARPIRSSLTFTSSWYADANCLLVWEGEVPVAGQKHCPGVCVCVLSPECMYLKVFGSFFIAGHEHKLCTDAAEMHVAQNCCTLYCCFVCWLKRKYKTGISFKYLYVYDFFFLCKHKCSLIIQCKMLVHVFCENWPALWVHVFGHCRRCSWLQ